MKQVQDNWRAKIDQEKIDKDVGSGIKKAKDRPGKDWQTKYTKQN